MHRIRKKLRKIEIKLHETIDFLACFFYTILKYVVDRSVRMGISYKKLWILLIEKDITPATLRKDLNIATGTMTKLRRNEEVALSVLLRICEYLDCNIGDICDAVKIDSESISLKLFRLNSAFHSLMCTIPGLKISVCLSL